MIARTLAPEEWSKLEGPQANELLALAHPEDVLVAVVEDEGKIIGQCSIVKITHLEGLWLDEKHKNAGASAALLNQIVKTAKEWANGAVIAGAAEGDDKMLGILARLGASRLPCQFFALRIGD